MPRVLTALTVVALSIPCVPACSTSGPAPASGDDAAALDTAIRTYDRHLLEARLQTLAPGADRDYVAGMLAARSGRSDEAAALLNRALPALRDRQPERAATVLKALANVSFLTSRYRDAALAYDDLDRHFTEALRKDVEDDAALARIVRDVPAQTITWAGPVRLRTSRNPIGSVNAELDADGVREQWLLDTGANQSVVSASFAARLGIAPLPGTALVGSGTTGLKSPLRVGVVPTLRIGGATVRHVVVLILDDENLTIGLPGAAYKIHAILGLPVLKALGAVTFRHEGEFLADESMAPASGVPIYMRGLTPAIECSVDGQPLLFTFDTGASSSGFSVRYYERFRQAKERSWQTRTVQTGGAGGSVTQTMFSEPKVALDVGGITVTLDDVSIPSSPAGAEIDTLFGNLGQDLVADFESYTLDLRNMRFSLGPRRAAAAPD